MNFLLAYTLPGYAIKALVGTLSAPTRIHKGLMTTEFVSEPPSRLEGIPV